MSATVFSPLVDSEEAANSQGISIHTVDNDGDDGGDTFNDDTPLPQYSRQVSRDHEADAIMDRRGESR